MFVDPFIPLLFDPYPVIFTPGPVFLTPGLVSLTPAPRGQKNRREGVEKTGGPVRQEPVECKAFCLDLEHYPILLSQLLETQQDPFNFKAMHLLSSSVITLIILSLPVFLEKNGFFCH